MIAANVKIQGRPDNFEANAVLTILDPFRGTRVHGLKGAVDVKESCFRRPLRSGVDVRGARALCLQFNINHHINDLSISYGHGRIA